MGQLSNRRVGRLPGNFSVRFDIEECLSWRSTSVLFYTDPKLIGEYSRYYYIWLNNYLMGPACRVGDIVSSCSNREIQCCCRYWRHFSNVAVGNRKFRCYPDRRTIADGSDTDWLTNYVPDKVNNVLTVNRTFRPVIYNDELCGYHRIIISINFIVKLIW